MVFVEGLLAWFGPFFLHMLPGKFYQKNNLTALKNARIEHIGKSGYEKLADERNIQNHYYCQVDSFKKLRSLNEKADYLNLPFWML